MQAQCQCVDHWYGLHNQFSVRVLLLWSRVASNFRDTFPGFFKVFKVTFEPFSRSQIAKFKVFQGLPQHRTYIELSIISDKIDWMYNKLGIISEKFDQMYNTTTS